MRFRYQAVLRDINLTIHRGETVCIIGESGCGKTVMLKLIIGLLQPTQGKRLVRRPRRRRARRQGTGQDAAAVRVPVPDGRAVRQPDGLRQRGLRPARAPPLRRGRRSGRSSPIGSRKSACRRRSRRRSRPSSPAASASASAWPGPWRSARRSCSTTSRPPGSTRS